VYYDMLTINSRWFIALCAPYCAYLLFTTISLFDPEMTAARYLMLALACDLFWHAIFSAIFLKRGYQLYHWGAIFLALMAFMMHDMVSYDGTSVDNW
jgi:hypothetical protein